MIEHPDVLWYIAGMVYGGIMLVLILLGIGNYIMKRRALNELRKINEHYGFTTIKIHRKVRRNRNG